MAACLLFNFLLHTFEVACGVLHPYYFNLCVSEWTSCHILRPLWWHLQCTLLRGFQWHSRCIVGQILLLCSLQNYAVKQAVPQYRQCKKKIYIKSINFLKGSSRTPHGWWKKMQHRKQTVLQIAQPYLAVVCVWQREFTSVVRSILCSYSGPYSEVFVRQSQHNFFVAQQVTVVSW